MPRKHEHGAHIERSESVRRVVDPETLVEHWEPTPISRQREAEIADEADEKQDRMLEQIDKLR